MVILLAVPAPLVLVLSCESADALRGVTPWKVWNIPPWVGTGMVGAIVMDGCKGVRSKIEVKVAKGYLWSKSAWDRPET